MNSLARPAPIRHFLLIQAVLPANDYLLLRQRWRSTPSLAEKPDQAPPEFLLQQVWLHQRLLRDKLQTVDGRPVRVLHPGFWNREPGPDFCQAVIQIGTDPPLSGDVEIDLIPGAWEQHAHHSNAAYRKVILQVTWEPGTSRGNLPVLSLKDLLDSSLPELTFWLSIEPKPMPEGLPGKCSAPLRTLPEADVHRMLYSAAMARLQSKAEQLQARARQVGCNNALWEGLFAALGYKRNTWPMRRVAELLPLIMSDLPATPDHLPLLQARLFGVAGLLPPGPLPTRKAQTYLQNLWSIWWRDASRFSEHRLPPGLWSLGGIRPANSPQRRLALAAHWLVQDNLPDRLENWMLRKIEAPDLLPSLLEILQVPHDEFWSSHWTFQGRPLKQCQGLIGEHRVTDLAVNVILPWLGMRAASGQRTTLLRSVEQRYFLWPLGEDNAVLRLARNRLFGGAPAKILKTAAQQQALLQIVRDFCNHSNAICENCPFPELVGSAKSMESSSSPQPELPQISES